MKELKKEIMKLLKEYGGEHVTEALTEVLEERDLMAMDKLRDIAQKKGGKEWRK